MNKTGIGWTDRTWNPVVGCSKISAGCANCYAEELSLRFNFTPSKWTGRNAKENVILKPERLTQPSKVKDPQLVFTCSMSDLFHEQVPGEYIGQIFDVMADNPQHQFQVLTKRIEAALYWNGDFPQNMWLGTSVENRDVLHRIETLQSIDINSVKFLSIEPLLEDLGTLNLEHIDWVIIGGESGRNFRPMDPAWARNIRDQCKATNIPIFFKQNSGLRPEKDAWLQEEHPLQKTQYRQMPRNVNLPDHWLF